MTAVEGWPEVGERVREARLAAGMSQGQLAAAVGLDRTAIVRIEAGQRQLSALELFGVADTLGLPLAHFVNRPPEAMISRRQRILDAPDSVGRIRFGLDAALEAHARDTQQLVGYGVLTPTPPPEPGVVNSVADAVDLARRVRKLLGVESGPLGSLAEVAEKLGLFVSVVGLDADGASMVVDSYGVAVIGNTEPGRRRWTAAHELGHHIVRDEYHADIGVAASRDEREQLIDLFAGELLLPVPDLIAKSHSSSGGLRELLIGVAADYRMSWTAVVERARRAKLVDAGEAQRLRARSPVRGDFLALLGREPEPDLAVGDRGPLWKQAVLRAHRGSLITGERAVELLGGWIGLEDLPEPEPW